MAALPSNGQVKSGEVYTFTATVGLQYAIAFGCISAIPQPQGSCQVYQVSSAGDTVVTLADFNGVSGVQSFFATEASLTIKIFGNSSADYYCKIVPVVMRIDSGSPGLVTTSNIANNAVTSLAGQKGAITIGSGLSMTGKELNTATS